MSWCDLSEIRKFQIESNKDLTFSKVFVPKYLEKLSNFNEKKIIEIGCGTGHLAKELTNLIKFEHYIALEPSLGMYEKAKDTLKNCKYLELNNFYISDLKSSIEVDIILAHLVFHVVEDIDSLLKESFKRLKPNATLVISLPHPFFYNDYKKIFSKNEYSYHEEIKKNTLFKISQDNTNEVEVPYIHRPISYYINKFSKAGFKISELEEVFPEESIQLLYPELWQSPRYCIFYLEKILVD
ncbi:MULTISPECIES: bifunctional 2-polyprenyl-6-hydroxyphenol methylase/3-demethylubiquinol 3-O-methyltransferase UbiG [unclassified Acinetobacter]|uniref:class I SAM-dependent methyltransferase n=1 Tax=unclassified Acinetobacter TaxID=196816 RepID=UPI0015D10E80|nr:MULTISPECIES: class I SAM-dependent methyltransferase [unclassified Acinetobacter]